MPTIWGCAKTDLNFGSGQTEGKNNHKNFTCDHGIKFNVKVQAPENNGSLRSLLLLAEMVTQKQSLNPSFASVLSLLCIVFYCAGFLRVELELNEQKKRINALENNGPTEPRPSFEPSLVDLPTTSSLGKFVDLKSRLFVYCLT